MRVSDDPINLCKLPVAVAASVDLVGLDGGPSQIMVDLTPGYIVSVCTSGNAKMLHDSSTRPVMAILFSVKFFSKGPINAPWTMAPMTPTLAKI